MIKYHIRTIIIFLAIAFIFALIANYVAEFKNAVKQIEQNINTYTYTCEITEFPYSNGNNIRVFASIVSSDNPYCPTGYKIQLDIDKDYFDILKYGNIIEIEGIIETANQSANYGNFDYRNYLMSKNTFALCDSSNIQNINLISESGGIDKFLYKLQLKAVLNIENYFSGNDRALIKAMLTGDRGDIDESLTELYKKAGIYHIVAVSGLHTGIFISVIALILALLPLSKRTAAMLSKIAAIIVSVLLYMFTGYGISITRVIAMSAIAAVCLITKRKYNITMSIITAAYIILLIMPYQIFSNAFQLSFLSTLGLCIALDIQQKYSKGKQSGYLSSSLVISAGSCIATAPLCAYCFGFISTVACVSNIVVIPLATALLISSVIFCVLCTMLPEQLLNIIKYIPQILSKCINSAADLVTKSDFCVWRVNITQILLIYAVAAVILCVILFIVNKKPIAAILTVIITSVTVSAFVCLPENKMKVTFINCLNGEATLVSTPNGSKLLFDCGSESFQNPAEDLFETYFMHHNIKCIDTLYISYFDLEHINAVNKLMVGGYINKIAIPPETDVKNSNIATNRKKVINTAERFGVDIVHIKPDAVHYTPDGISISAVGNNFELKDKNAAAVYKIQYGETSFILSSCLGANGQKQLTDASQCTVLKTPNYGNWVKATAGYIVGAQPEYAVVTVPPKNKYLKIDDKLTDLLESNNIPLYRTDIHQTITFITDGKQLEIKTRKGEKN